MTYLEEIAYLNTLLESYHIVAYRIGYSVSKSLKTFDRDVVKEIEAFYLEMKNN